MIRPGLVKCLCIGAGIAWMVQSGYAVTNIVGTYASPLECSGFQSVAVSIGTNWYSSWFESDVLPQDKARPIRGGTYCRQGNDLYMVLICILSEWVIANPRDPAIVPRVEKWTLTNINESVVLMRDDALACWTNENRIMPYGVLIKIGDTTTELLRDVKHPSIKDIENGSAPITVDRDNPASRVKSQPATSRTIGGSPSQ